MFYSFIRAFFKKNNDLIPDKPTHDKYICMHTANASRRLVIPDVHGCPKTLASFIDTIRLQKSDYLFFLGDYIDKGSDSKGVLDIIIDLKKQGFNVFPLRGNHEDDGRL